MISFISENNSESLLYIHNPSQTWCLHFRVQIIHEYYILAIEVTTANEFIKAPEKQTSYSSLLKEELVSFQNIKGYLPKIITVHMFPRIRARLKLN